MAKSEKKRQAKALKKRRKRQAAVNRSRRETQRESPRGIIKRARNFPLHDCWIDEGWADSGPGLVQVVISRQKPDGGLVAASFLIDMLCLGVKDAVWIANVTAKRYEEELLSAILPPDRRTECPIELAHQLIYSVVDYAAQYGFKPHNDFKWAKYLLEPRGTYPETYDLAFGRDGKPMFIPGPYDNVRAIVAKLDRNPGPGNYHYMMAPMDMIAMDEDFEDDEDYEFDDEETDDFDVADANTDTDVEE